MINSTRLFSSSLWWIQELKKSGDDNFIEELRQFLKIVNNNEVDEKEFYKHLEFGHEDHEDEDCVITFMPARNYSTNVTFDGEFPDSGQEPTFQCQPSRGRSLT